MSEYSALASVERAFQVIEILVGEVNGVSVTELVKQTKLSKSMVSRILTTLHEQGYVERDESTRHYKLSFHFMSTVYRHINALGFEEIFYPLLERTSERTGELIQIGVVREDGIYFVAKIEGKDQLKVASMLGKRAPYHATATGKVWLASLPDEEALTVIGKTGLKEYTEYTITDIKLLLEDLETVRANGYAIANQEINPEVFAIALPIYDKHDQDCVIAVLVVAVPQYKMTQEREKEIFAICKEEIENFDTSLLSPFGFGYTSKQLHME